MNALIVGFALLCAVGSVFCGPDRIGIREPIRLPPLRCYAQHGGWFNDELPIQSWPVSTSPSTLFYFGCKVWRPTWSSCKGYCESSQNLTSVRNPTPRPDTDCKCCRSLRCQIVKPYPRCWVIRINGLIPSVKFETVRQRVNNYSYTLAGKCGCQACGGRLPRPNEGPAGPVEPEEIDEDQVIGRPTPPEVSEAERTEAFRQIPTLGGRNLDRELA